MVSVLVPLDGKVRESVVPYSAVIYDAYGGVWIYLDRTVDRKGTHIYERRRVELGPALGDEVVVRPTLRPEDNVVIDGAAKLFSREFYKPPVPR
jgi:multidrug efflux pump subunit AcrA (membrane-fusion protein)